MRMSFLERDFANGSVIPEASAVARHQSKGRLTIVEKGTDGIHPMDVIFKLMRAARAVDASVTFGDAKGKEVTMLLFDDHAPEEFNQAFDLVNVEGKHPAVMLGVQFDSVLTFERLQRGVMPMLRANKAFFRPCMGNQWKPISAAALGFVLKVNPKFVSIDEHTWFVDPSKLWGHQAHQRTHQLSSICPSVK